MKPLMMIPGPVEISPAVLRAYAVAPPSHVAPQVIEAFANALEQMRAVWASGPESQPFVIAGSGTLAMEMAVTNVLDPGDHALVVHTGYFSERMAEMLRRRGAEVHVVEARLGDHPTLAAIARALERAPSCKAIFATHVDTSTGVRVDARGLCLLASEHGALSIFDGVCATGAERFEMESWGADVYLTASQKALGLPAGLGLLVASERALEARASLHVPPPMSIDFCEWRPIMRAYESRRPSYFATPATNLILGLDVGLKEILGDEYDGHRGVHARWKRHERAGRAMRAAWDAMRLERLPARAACAANTLSAIEYPGGVDSGLLARIKANGVVVAGGLHPVNKDAYFRVGHMGHAVTRPEWLLRTVDAVEAGLRDMGHDVEAGTGREAAAALLG